MTRRRTFRRSDKIRRSKKLKKSRKLKKSKKSRKKNRRSQNKNLRGGADAEAEGGNSEEDEPVDLTELIDLTDLMLVDGLRREELAEHLLCPLSVSLSFMRDPVVIDSGQTYEKVDIEEWKVPSFSNTLCVKLTEYFVHNYPENALSIKYNAETGSTHQEEEADESIDITERILIDMLLRRAELATILTCPVSLSFMREPVVIESGQTYEKVDIEEWNVPSFPNTLCEKLTEYFVYNYPEHGLSIEYNAAAAAASVADAEPAAAAGADVGPGAGAAT